MATLNSPNRQAALPEDAARCLREIAIFRHLDDRTLAALATASTRHTCRRGTLLDPGDARPTTVYAIISGRVRLLRLSPDGMQITLATLSSGDILGLAADTSGGIAEVASDETVVYRLPRSQVVAAMAGAPSVATAALDHISDLLAAAYAQIEDLAFSPVKARLARLLARLALLSSESLVMATHAELAALVGTRQETITKELRSLRQRGLVTYRPHGRGIRVIDRVGLDDLSTKGR